MKRLLIVDDERHVADYLFELFALDSEMELEVHKAYSAQEAIEQLYRNKMDAVLSDIRMPGMSGLELMEYISRRWPMCRVIFLTGYKSFDYIYEATKYPHTMYLMKTEDDDVIRAAVYEQLKEQDKELYSQRMLEQTLARSTLLEQSAFLQGLENGRYSRRLEQATLDRLHIPLSLEKPLLLTAAPLDDGRGGVVDTALSLHAILQKQMSSLVSCVVWIDSEGLMYWVLQPLGEAPDPLNVRDQIEDVQSSCHELLGLELSLVMGRQYIGWPDFSETCARLRTQALYYLPRGERLVQMEQEPPRAAEEEDVLGNEKALEALEMLLREGSATKELLLSRLNQVLEPLRPVSSMHSLGAIELYQSVALLLLREINRADVKNTMAFHTALYKLSNAASFSSWQEAIEYLNQVASLLFDLRRESESDYRSQMCERIKRFVEENLAGDLSLSTIADFMRYNPSYISRIFKQLEGMNLSEYILGQRLNLAKDLLRGNKHTISEIALAVGFDSPQYFATVFKKHLGISPHKYRVQIE